MTTPLVISIDDFLVFANRTIDGMVATVRHLDDHQVNDVPDLAGANSAFVLMNHALAACVWWTETVICGHHSDRDRAKEFHSTGSVAELEDLASAASNRLAELRDELSDATALTIDPAPENPLAGPWTVGAALMHSYEELAQHLGHLEITADLVRRASA